MPIQEGDIKLLASERMTDFSDGGGRVTGNVIPDGVSNNVFPDISELDRTYGRVNLRKVFAAAHTDDNDHYFGAHLILADAPEDPRVSATLFSTRDWVDLRTGAVDRLESYLARGPRFQGYLYDQHIAGQKALLVLMRLDRELPATGATLVVVKNPGLAGEVSQFVRVTKVSAVVMTFDAPGCATFSRQVVTLEISDPLNFDVPGGQPHCQDDTAQAIASRLYATVVADAAKYYGIRPLAQAADIGALAVRADTVFSPLVPSAQTEIPIVDAKPHGDAVNPTPVRGSTVTIATGAPLSPTSALYAGQAIVPGSLTITGSGLTLTDLGGVLMSGTTSIGLVDYANGLVTVSAGGPSVASASLTFRPAAAPARAMQTAAWAVTPESRSQTVVSILDPIPAPGTLAVHYMAQGRWYVLRDNAAGQLRGEDTAFGSGVLNYSTGSVVVTLGALPDVGSQVLFTYGVTVLEMDRSGAVVKAFQEIQLATAEAIVPSTVTIEWEGGAKTATDDGDGNLTGDASGRVNYADRVVTFMPNVLPAGGADIEVTVSTSERTASAAITPGQAGGRLTFTLPPSAAIRPGTVAISIPVVWPGLSVIPAESRHVGLFDDGAGNIKHGAATVGTVNYATGAVDVPDAYGLLSRDYTFLLHSGPVGDTHRSLFSPSGAMTTRTFAYQGGAVSASFSETGTPSSLPLQTFTWSPKLDVTPAYKEQIVPGSVRVSFAGKTLLDRNGGLVMDLNHANGAATACGTIDYATGLADVTGAAIPGQANTATVTGLLTTLYGHPVDEVTFRTPAAPVRPGSLLLQFARASGGGTVTVTAGTDGVISDTDVLGLVDYQTGIARVRFGQWVTAAGNEGEDWYNPAAVVGGQIFRPAHVIAETLRFAAVAYAYLPLDASILGLNPVRLPSDGRVPIFAPGYVAVVHHTQKTTGTWANGNVVDLGRTRIARVRVLEDDGSVVATSRYDADMDTGMLTWLNVTGLAQPLTIEDRIEDMGLISDAQINGQLTLTRPITHDYPAPGSFVSSALIVGDMSARVANVFDQSTWTGVWSDTLIGSEPTANFNDVAYPITTTNRGAIQEQWALIFTSSTAFRVVGRNIGEIAVGNTSSNLAPVNPSTGVPYFSLNALGWGAGWASNNVLRFNTIAASFPVWLARTIQQGPATVDDDKFTLQIRGDIDA